MQLSYDYAKDRALICLRANYESHLWINAAYGTIIALRLSRLRRSQILPISTSGTRRMAVRVSTLHILLQGTAISTPRGPSKRIRAHSPLTGAHGRCAVLLGAVLFSGLRVHDSLSFGRHLSDVCPRGSLQVFPVKRLVRPLVVVPLDEPRYGVLRTDS